MNPRSDVRVVDFERARQREWRRRWSLLAVVAALVSIVAWAAGSGPSAYGGATPPTPLGTYVGQTGSGRWIILTASAAELSFSMSVADCQVGSGLSFNGQIPISSTFAVNGGDNPTYWMSGSFDGSGFASGFVGMRRFDGDTTTCEHEEPWTAQLSTPAPTTVASTSVAPSTSTSTSTSSSTTTTTSTTLPTATTLAPVTSAPPTVSTSPVSVTVGPETSAPPSSSPAVVSTTTAPVATNPIVATSDAPGATPALVATVAQGRVSFGEPTTVQAAGFAPGERVTATLHSTPRRLGTLTADASGTVRLIVTVTLDDGPGRHDVVFVGERSGTVSVGLIATTQTLPATR